MSSCDYNFSNKYNGSSGFAIEVWNEGDADNIHIRFRVYRATSSGSVESTATLFRNVFQRSALTPSTQYQHITITIDSAVSLFVNGDLFTTSIENNAAPAAMYNSLDLSKMSPLTLGGDWRPAWLQSDDITSEWPVNWTDNFRYFRGRIFSAALFKKVRTGAQIHADVSKVNPTDADLIAYYNTDMADTDKFEFGLAEDGKSYTIKQAIVSSPTALVMPATYKGLPVLSIADYAFDGRKSVSNLVTELVLPEGLETIGKEAFFENASIAKINFPASLTSIGEGAFRWMDELEEVILSEGITTLNSRVFDNCDTVKYFYIPKTVTYIGDSCLSYCKNLIAIYIDAGNLNYKTFNGSLYSYNGEHLIQYALARGDKEFKVPTGVKYIHRDAFGECGNVTGELEVILPNTVKELGNGAFYNCYKCKVDLPNSIEYIGPSALQTLSYRSLTLTGSLLDSSDDLYKKGWTVNYYNAGETTPYETAYGVLATEESLTSKDGLIREWIRPGYTPVLK